MSDEALEGLRRDQDGLREIEQALEESERKYRHLYLHTPAMLHSIDAEGRLLSVSRRWLQVLGYRWDEVIGRRSTEFLTPESCKYAQEVVLPDFFRTGVCKDVPYQFVKKDGTILDIELSGIAEWDDQGRLVRSLAVLTDVTERKQAERALREAEEARRREQQAVAEVEAARELDRLKTTFVNALSHDLRAPLTSIFGYLEFLDEEIGGPLTGQQRDYVAQIERSSRRLERLANGLLDFARFEAGTLRLQPEPADLSAQIREVLESVVPQAQSAGLRLGVQLPEAPLEVVMDVPRIERVLLNLLSNAIKFTPRGGEIRISAWQEAGGVRCEVSDTGVGIAPGDLPKLFHRFVQLEAGETRGGAGLGLNISKGIIEGHGGRIGVTSVPGQGSTFWFTLPFTPPEGPAEDGDTPHVEV